MSVELRPLGVLCNIQCQYCYQNPQRDTGNLSSAYDMAKMKEAIRAEGGPFSLFGGEPLLVPLADLKDLWSWGLAKFGHNSVQTNGTLITDAHVELFKKYRVQVGISLDGPGPLNDARWHGSLKRTREATAKAEAVIDQLCREGIPPSLILTLHRANATADKLPILFDWVRYLDRIGVRWARLHLLESESEAVRAKYALSNRENIEALIGFAELQRELQRLNFDLFEDMRRMLEGRDESTTCVWNACDPYTTRAVRGVEGHGQRSNCGRTNKDGIDFVKSETPGFERYLALYLTPQEAGGCRGCRFFLMCKGQCPGTAIDGDWRNRTEHCEVWKALYERIEAEFEAEGMVPLSRDPRRVRLEQALLRAWSEGRQVPMAQWLRPRPQQRPVSSPERGRAAGSDLEKAVPA
jgi:uncharacterized protein